MAEVKLTKNELRDQQTHLTQLEKYLPTLQLKKAMLQSVMHEVRQRIEELEVLYLAQRKQIDSFAELFTVKMHVAPLKAAEIKQIKKRYENIAGVEVPYFEGIEFIDFTYNLFETPPWVDSAIVEIRKLATLREEIRVTEEQKAALEKEWREVSIRVNLFEKILIPRAMTNIKKIKVFLGDQQLASVSRAKVAKSKMTAHKENKEELFPCKGELAHA